MISAHGCESCISQAPGENTSYTIVLAPKGLDRFFLHDPGCNDTFGYADVDFGKVGKRRIFILVILQSCAGSIWMTGRNW